MSDFTATPARLGRKGHLVASWHLTEGRALADPNALFQGQRERACWDAGKKPLCYQKILGPGGTSAAGVAAILGYAQQHGWIAILQIRDDEPGGYGVPTNVGRDSATAQTFVAAQLDALETTYSVIPDGLAYSNEPGGNTAASTPEYVAGVRADVYNNEKNRIPLFMLGDYGSWHEGLEHLQTQINAMPNDVLHRCRFLTFHHYNGRPSMIIETGILDVIRQYLPWAEIVLSEGDLTFQNDTDPAPAVNENWLWDYRGATWLVMSKLVLAVNDVYSCDYTLQTSTSGADGNGVYKYGGTKHPSAVALEEIIYPFAHSSLVNMIRNVPYDSVEVFGNAARQMVATNFPTDPEDSMPKYIRQLAQAEEPEVDHSYLGMADILNHLNDPVTYPTPPDYSPNWTPNYEAIQPVFDRMMADWNSGAGVTKVVSVGIENIPGVRALTTLGTVDDGVTAPTAMLDNVTREITLTLPPWSTIYLQGSAS